MSPNHSTEKFSPIFATKEMERTGGRSRKGLWDACVVQIPGWGEKGKIAYVIDRSVSPWFSLYAFLQVEKLNSDPRNSFNYDSSWARGDLKRSRSRLQLELGWMAEENILIHGRWNRLINHCTSYLSNFSTSFAPSFSCFIVLLISLRLALHTGCWQESQGRNPYRAVGMASGLQICKGGVWPKACPLAWATVGAGIQRIILAVRSIVKWY